MDPELWLTTQADCLLDKHFPKTDCVGYPVEADRRRMCEAKSVASPCLSLETPMFWSRDVHKYALPGHQRGTTEVLSASYRKYW